MLFCCSPWLTFNLRALDSFHLMNVYDSIIFQFVNTNSHLFWVVVPVLLGMLGLLIHSSLKIQSQLANKFVEDYNASDSNSREYQLYLLFLGIIIPVVEIAFEIFKVRVQSALILNGCIGGGILFAYFITKKSIYIFNHIQKIFIFFFLLYFMLICRNLMFKSFEILTMIAFIVAFFFSYVVIRPIRFYWFFVV